MKFYRLTIDSGNGFQVVVDQPPRELLQKELYAPYTFDTIDSLLLDLDKKKKKTDVLLVGTLGLLGFPAHDRVCEILKDFHLRDVQFVKITGGGLDDYQFVFFNSDLTSKLDYHKTHLAFIKDFLGDIEELDIEVPKNRNGAIKIYRKHAFDSTFNKMIPKNGYHFLLGFDINEYDGFRIGHFDKSFYVSENVKNALEAAQITNIVFSESTLFNNPEPVVAPIKKTWKFW
ncbi:MAG: hypothetical protein EOO50_00560 [Flavobacterium sp.]|uniref:hypothetical protein n=1 Tax=Flavobacterium sp. TaxID=239 RepID=UPI00121061E4|nr:hypothetical protein [Flavobacterium sp.]RZJ68705.1 MAG: hypothetical protein EOO50_00560 [Flavobacterium sp.]